MAAEPTSRCVSCGAVRTGEYCHECGERRITAADRTIAALVRHGLEAITDIDSRGLRTLRRLVFSPGYLTKAFATGQRKPYLGPVQLFLLANLAYFLVQPLTPFSGYNTPLVSQLTQQGYSGLLPVSEWVDAATARSGLDAAAFEAVYNNQSDLLARSLVFLMVPLFALFLPLLTIGRRRLFVDHLVFALHYFAFDLLIIHCIVLMFWQPLINGAIGLVRATVGGGETLTTVGVIVAELGPNLLITVPYLYFAYRRFFGVGRWRALPTALISLVALYVSISVYRLLLLLVTLATV